MMQYTISKEVSLKYLEKKSSFTAYLFFFKEDDDVQKHISYVSKKQKDARHIPYAYRYIDSSGALQEMYSDDGEPGKTAGFSALRVLQQKNVVNVCVVIARTFGGVKLGTSGLMRAFAQSCQSALTEADLKEFIQTYSFELFVAPAKIRVIETFCKQKGIEYLVSPATDDSHLSEMSVVCTVSKDNSFLEDELSQTIINN